MNKPNNRVLCFGELLIRLQSSANSLFTANDNKVKIYPGGSEANVAVTLAKLGVPTSYFTVLPKNQLTEEIENIIVENQVNISKILHAGDRIGTYYLLSANGLTNGEVIYDRKYSSFSHLTVKSTDWDSIYDGIEWLHFSAITPALSENLAELTELALDEALKRNITISVDLNYRSKLWQYGKKPIEIMPKLVRYADIIMGNIWAAHKMLGTSIELSLDRNTAKEEYVQYANKVAIELMAKFPKAKHIANTFRFMDTSHHNLFYGTYHTPNLNVFSETKETFKVVDRIGSGDAFMGGLIYAIIRNLSPQEIIETATSAGFEKLFVEGDFGNGKI
ncbi:sugar kinase [Sphingobacterium composti Ten et al. 2007 non Yoo et al. 2007]|uniref:sugar kinase n=1 Tax=Sphingobacterium composti TaxID=363260 RepID=UPI0013595F1F|nr:sugar kinase [Sphingobacterium composti Ten et al. 2007 non Yoo et al. 2007]